jgi:hypothetical protein
MPRKKPRLPRALEGRPTFDVTNVRGCQRELRIWFAWTSAANRLVGQRAVLLGMFHEALSAAKELPTLQAYISKGRRLVDRHYQRGSGQTQSCEILERHIAQQEDFAYLVRSVSDRAAESLVYTIDAMIKDAGNAACIGGRRDQYLRGGRYLAKGLTLLEGFRVVANWQRHRREWRSAPVNPKNFNHKALRKLGLWDARDDVPLRFLRSLRRRSYFALERDLHAALEYLVCEIGMRHPSAEASKEDRRNSFKAVNRSAAVYAAKLRKHARVPKR